MKALIAACAFALSTHAAIAADGCVFIHETDPGQWVRITDAGFIWHKDADDFTYRTEYADDRTSLRGAVSFDGSDGNSQNGLETHEVWYRIADVDGRKTFIFETRFYYETCGVASIEPN